MESALHPAVLPQPEGKEMKHIVHDFATSQEDGALESRCVCSILNPIYDAEQNSLTANGVLRCLLFLL